MARFQRLEAEIANSNEYKQARTAEADDRVIGQQVNKARKTANERIPRA